jgi:two-component system C4-dicarboxylate transport sensor histidine kinase DctB
MPFRNIPQILKARVPLVFLFAVAILIASNEFSTRVFQSIELEKSRSKLSLYKTIVENELSRLQHLPLLIAQDVSINSTAGLNEKLKSISVSSKAEAIYVLDRSGQTIAASNFDQVQTFLGQNYQFRPYFAEAMKGKDSTFFAIGATTSRPGYFLATPIIERKRPIGALVVKLDLTALNQALAATSDKIVVTNKDGIIVLSSVSNYRYRSTKPINQARMTEIGVERQFGAESLTALEWDIENEAISLAGKRHLLASEPLAEKGWQLYYLADANFARTRALTVSAILAALMIGASTLFFFWREKRVRKALVTSQQDRRRLQREIEVRRKAEQKLESAQIALKRTSKLAALGQLSASVTHELGQPISAMKNHIAADLLINNSQPNVMTSLSGIVDRMDNITKQLKFFATPDAGLEENLELHSIAMRAVELMRYDFQTEGVKVVFATPKNKPTVYGNAQRLEQVIINILRNSIKAMQDIKEKRIEIAETYDTQFCTLSIRDNGHGLLGQSFDQIIEPFHTTGPSGEGMGLGLAISASIIEEHGGVMSATDIETGGVLFEIKLPMADG